jgi:hypothetical protein
MQALRAGVIEAVPHAREVQGWLPDDVILVQWGGLEYIWRGPDSSTHSGWIVSMNYDLTDPTLPSWNIRFTIPCCNVYDAAQCTRFLVSRRVSGLQHDKCKAHVHLSDPNELLGIMCLYDEWVGSGPLV